MPLVDTDVVLKGSNKSATKGDTTLNAGPGTNLGGRCTAGILATDTLSSIFPNVTSSENAASNQDYQCMFAHNTHPTLTAYNVVVYQDSKSAGGVDIAFGVDPTAATDVNASAVQALNVTDKNTAPAGVAFSTPTTRASGLSLGDIAPGKVKAFWVRRSAKNNTAVNNDSIVIGIGIDTIQ